MCECVCMWEGGIEMTVKEKEVKLITNGTHQSGLSRQMVLKDQFVVTEIKGSNISGCKHRVHGDQ